MRLGSAPRRRSDRCARPQCRAGDSRRSKEAATGRVAPPVLAFGFAALLGAAAPPLSFVPVNSEFAGASDEYRAIWTAEGEHIVSVLEATSGLTFKPSPIEVIVSNNPPMTTFDGATIRLSARYPRIYKKATLVHELGHSLVLPLRGTAGLDDHRLLYLFLYDAWIELEGQDFADRMVSIERRIPGGYDYDAAWRWALAMTREQRQARLAAARDRSPAMLRTEDPPRSREAVVNQPQCR